MKAPGRLSSGRSANRSTPRCVGTTPASVSAASLWASSVEVQSAGRVHSGKRLRKYFSSRRSWRSRRRLPNTGRSSMGSVSRRALSRRASRSAGIGWRWLPIRCRNRPSLVWWTSKRETGTSTIRHNFGSSPSPGRYSQFRAGTTSGLQFVVATLTTNCSRRSRPRGSMPTTTRSASRTPMTTKPAPRVGHADEDLGELLGGAPRFGTEGDPIASEHDLLQLEPGVFAGPDGGQEPPNVQRHHTPA